MSLAGSTAPEISARWAALEHRYAPLLVDHLGFGAPLRDVAGYVLTGGKRLRPLLAELIGQVVDAPPAAITQVGVAMEYLHAASVLLDDLPCMDNASTRHGMPPAHVRFSEAQAILTAVALTSRSYALLLSAPVPRAHARERMAKLACDTVAGAMTTGQAMDLGHAEPASIHRVRSAHEGKTASLFGLVGNLAVACGSASQDRAASLVDFATLLGRAYQILDDIEDQGAPDDVGVNLARMVGRAGAATEARETLRAARKAIETIQGTEALSALVDWFERRLDGLA